MRARERLTQATDLVVKETARAVGIRSTQSQTAWEQDVVTGLATAARRQQWHWAGLPGAVGLRSTKSSCLIASGSTWADTRGTRPRWRWRAY